MSCITEQSATQFVDMLKRKGATFIKPCHYTVGPVLSPRIFVSQTKQMFNNIINGFKKSNLIFCQLSTFSQKFVVAHAVVLCCIKNEDGSVILEFFDSNGLLEPFSKKPDMFWTSLLSQIVKLFKIQNVNASFVEMNIRPININQCNSWSLFYYYTRCLYAGKSTKDFFNFVFTWDHSMINIINKFIRKESTANTFNKFIASKTANIVNKNNYYKKIVNINMNYNKYNYRNFSNVKKQIPASIVKKIKSLKI
jgi:hypothetical protein